MKRPRPFKAKAKIVTGPKKASTVSKIRRTSQQSYGDLYDWLKLCAEVKKLWGYKCSKCGRPESEFGLQVDHIVEVSKGGSNAKANLRPLCPICHAARPSHRKAKHLILHEVDNREKRGISKRRK